MKDEIKLYYAVLNNMGDLLNVLIIRDLFGFQVERRSFLTGEMTAIGSGLGQYTLHGSLPMKLQQLLNGFRYPEVWVWGTGFIDYAEKDQPFFKRGMRFCAVRGELSRRRAEKLLGRRLDIPTGDAGILASELIDVPAEKTWDVGVVPHICDINEPSAADLAGTFENSILIDLREDPYEVLRKIAACRVIISSSLHGLIAADSFGIPNRHVLLSDKPKGDGFKFDDYYSAYGVPHLCTDLRCGGKITLREIEESYPITREMALEKKKAMLACFPFDTVKPVKELK